MIIVPYKNFELIKKLKINNFKKAELVAIFCRINTLTMVKIAGSGHLGTSMSALDLFVWIKHFQFPVKKETINNVKRMLESKSIHCNSGKKITCEIDSICVHGDGKLALDIAISLRQNLIQEGFILKPLNQLNKFKGM